VTVRIIYPDGRESTVIGDTYDEAPATEAVIDLDALETIGGE
jgi:hypothetical protein